MSFKLITINENHELMPEIKTVSRQERRLAEREAAKLAKKKGPIIVRGLYNEQERSKQVNELIEQLLSLEVYSYLPSSFIERLRNHVSTGETIEEDYPIDEVGRTLEVRLYNERYKGSHTNFRNSDKLIKSEQQMQGYKKLEERMQEMSRLGQLGSH